MPDKPTIPNYPPQGIQAQLDLLYLYNPDVANKFIKQLEAGLVEMNEFQEQIQEELKKVEDKLTDIQGVMRYKGSVDTEADLPTEGNVNGDVWNILDTDKNVAWDGEKWDAFSSPIDTSNFITKPGPTEPFNSGVSLLGVPGRGQQPAWNLARLEGPGQTVASYVAPNIAISGTVISNTLSKTKLSNTNRLVTEADIANIGVTEQLVTDQSLSGLGTIESPLGLSQTIHNEIDSLAASIAELGADKIDTWESTKFVAPAFTFDSTGMAATSINLGELGDGIYEFVVNCRLGVRTGYGAYRVHIVIENGELKQNQDNTLSFICPFMDGKDGAGRLLDIYHNHSAPKAAYLDKEGNAFILKVTQAFMYTNLFLSHFFFGENQTVAGLTRVSYIKNMETEAFTAPSAITVSSTVEPKTEGTFIAFQSPMEMSVPTTVHRDVFGSVTANALLVNNTKGLMYQTLNVRLYDTENPKTQHFYADVTVYDTGNATVTSWEATGKFSGAQLAYDTEGNIFIRKANGTPILDGTLNVVSQMSWYHLDDTDVDLQYFLSSLTSTEGTAIPLATRMPALPTDTGTYALKCINGFPQWEYEGGAE